MENTTQTTTETNNIAIIPKSPRIAKSVGISRSTIKQAETHETNNIAKGRTPSNNTISLRWDVPLHHNAVVGKNYRGDDELEFRLSLDSKGTMSMGCDITKADLLEMVKHIEAIEAQKGMPIDHKNSFNAEWPKRA